MENCAYQSLYIHVPFCREKCAYCHFYSLPNVEEHDHRVYLQGLEREFAERYVKANAPLRSVFIGGGTPTVLSVTSMQKLFQLIGTYFSVSSETEITVETNPESLSPEKIAVMGYFNVNRLSIGVQSFNPHFRHVMGRRGTLKGLNEKIECCRKYGIEEMNFDLIYGIPGQSVQDWENDLTEALTYPLSHMSCYGLDVEEGDAVTVHPGTAPDENAIMAMWRLTDDVLFTKGLYRYEVSNFAVPGCECRHNMDVWHGETYMGCGPAASSFDGSIRLSNPADFESWLGGKLRDVDSLAPSARAAEILAFGLRTVQGWKRAKFYERTGFDFRDLCSAALDRLINQGLLTFCEEEERLRPTERGLLFADTIATEVLL